MNTIVIILLFLQITFIISKYPDNKTNPYFIYNFTTLPFANATKEYNETGKFYAYPSTIRISPKGDLFVSVPRHVFNNKTISRSIPGTINQIKDGLLYPWPSLEENTYNVGRLGSVVGFEIDLKGRLWLLNHRRKEREVIIYNKDGTYFKSINITTATIHRYHMSYLSNILLDLQRGFAYISDTGNIFGNPNDPAKTKSNIIVLNLENEFALKILQKDTSSKPEVNYEYDDTFKTTIKNIGLYGIALTCDKKHLYYSPVKSRQMYSLQTYKLQDEHAVRGVDEIQNYTKRFASFEITSSARGILYYTAIDDNSINVNFYERDITFSITRKVGHDKEKNKETLEEYPTSLTFNGTTGMLFYLVNKHNILLDKDITERIDDKKVNFQIMSVYVNDRSYLYPCNFFYYMPNHFWVFILVVSLGLAYILIRIIKQVGKLDKREKIKVKENEDLIGLDS